jgi:hypothetical protein
MMRFPPVRPDPSWRLAVRLPRDHYVRVDTNDYSVNPRLVGRRVEGSCHPRRGDRNV